MLSIIILTYNEKKFIPTCLNSIFNNYWHFDFEVILIDNGSTDKSSEYIKTNYPQVNLIINQKNKGVAKGRNQGIKASKGDYVLFLDIDTELTPNSLNKLYNFIKNYPKCALAGPQLLYTNRKLQYSCRTFTTPLTILWRGTSLHRLFKKAYFYKKHLYLNRDLTKTQKVDWVLGACQIINKKAIKEVGLLDEKYFFAYEDIDFCWRAAKKRWDIYYYPEATVIHNYQRKSFKRLFSRLKFEHIKSIIIFWAKIIKYDIKISKKQIIPLILFASDVLTVAAAFFTAYWLRDKGPFRIFLDSVQEIEVYISVLPLAIAFLILIFASYGLYKPQKRITKIAEFFNVTKATTVWILFIMSGSYLVKYDYSRIIIVLFYIINILFINLGRYFIRKYQFKMAPKINVAIIGAGKIGRQMHQLIKEYTSLGYELLGFIDDKTKHRESVKILGQLEELENIIEKNKLDEIYVANPSLSHKEILSMVSGCKNPEIEFKVFSNLFQLATNTKNINSLEDIPSLNLRKTNPRFFYNLTKRIIDLLGTSILLILTLPLWIIIFILIKIDSPGRAIFIQKRIGYKGGNFLFYKFRTMYQDTPHYAIAPTDPNDPRITRVGKWLRRTSLDELPQLINILRGDMSIVGPRPEMPFLVELYESWQRKRLEVKPGLTGLWQILGRKDIPLLDNMEYDFYYINNLSIKQDILIILKTIPVLIFGKGAY